MKKLNKEAKGFLCGILYSVGTMYSFNGDSVAVEEIIGTIGDEELKIACKLSSECDIKEIRRDVFPYLPFGVDAEYVDIKGFSVDFDDKKTEKKEDIYKYIISALIPSENREVIICSFDEDNEKEYKQFLSYAIKWEKKKLKSNKV